MYTIKFAVMMGVRISWDVLISHLWYALTMEEQADMIEEWAEEYVTSDYDDDEYFFDDKVEEWFKKSCIDLSSSDILGAECDHQERAGENTESIRCPRCGKVMLRAGGPLENLRSYSNPFLMVCHDCCRNEAAIISGTSQKAPLDSYGPRTDDEWAIVRAVHLGVSWDDWEKTGVPADTAAAADNQEGGE